VIFSFSRIFTVKIKKKEMEVIHKLLNIVAPPFTFFSLCLFLPPFWFYKLFLSILSSIFSENVAGKVVVITGASSGIGEVITQPKTIYIYISL
jgi:hypothetical protein